MHDKLCHVAWRRINIVFVQNSGLATWSMEQMIRSHVFYTICLVTKKRRNDVCAKQPFNNLWWDRHKDNTKVNVGNPGFHFVWERRKLLKEQAIFLHFAFSKRRRSEEQYLHTMQKNVIINIEHISDTFLNLLMCFNKLRVCSKKNYLRIIKYTNDILRLKKCIFPSFRFILHSHTARGKIVHFLCPFKRLLLLLHTFQHQVHKLYARSSK